MKIFVDGTTVIAWGDVESAGIPFDVDDFPGVQEGKVLHWDGIRWWYERNFAEPFEVLSALMQDTDALDALPDAVLARMAPYMEEWKPDTEYKIGNKLSYQEYPYRVLQDHISHEAYTPDIAVSLYARIIASDDPDKPLPWVQPDSTNAYKIGDRVTHNGYIWESDYDNNVWEPGIFGWHIINS